MILLVGSQKGGSGKSTTAVNIAAALAGKKRDVVLVDADRQSTAANWVADRPKDRPVVHCIQKYDNIHATLSDLANRYEYVIVDAAGQDSRELRTGMTVADLLLAPFKPSQPDLDTLPKLLSIITQAQGLNPGLSAYGLITMASANPVVNETREALDYFRDYPQIKPLETVICDRKIYRDAMSEGLGVTEMNNPKAVREIRSLVKELLDG